MVYVCSAQNYENEDWDLANVGGSDKVGTLVGVKRLLRNLQDLCKAKRRKMSESVSGALLLEEEVLNAPNEVSPPNETGPSERVEDESTDSVRHLKLKREAGMQEEDPAPARDEAKASYGTMSEKREEMAEMHHGNQASNR